MSCFLDSDAHQHGELASKKVIAPKKVIGAFLPSCLFACLSECLSERLSECLSECLSEYLFS
jgi:hypothetical protein